MHLIIDPWRLAGPFKNQSQSKRCANTVLIYAKVGLDGSSASTSAGTSETVILLAMVTGA